MKKEFFLFSFFLISLLVAIPVYSDNFGSAIGPLPQFIAVYLSNQTGADAQVGYGINGTNSAQDYSSKTEDYWYQPHENQTVRISKMIITIEDNSIDNSDDYGAITGGLDHGVAFIVRENGVERRIDGGINVTTNGDYHKIAYDVDFSNLGNGGDYLTVNWQFSNSGTEIRLNGSNNDSIIVRLHDDFSSIDKQFFKIQGYIEKDLGPLKVQEVVPEEEFKMEFLFYFVLIVSFILLILGLHKEDLTMLSLSGFLFMAMGLFLQLEGFDGLDNLMTKALVAIFMGFGLYVIFRANHEHWKQTIG